MKQAIQHILDVLHTEGTVYLSGNLLPVVLYTLSREDLKVEVIAKYNEKGDLVVEGCDSGEHVKTAWDDWDYEYSITIAADNLLALSKALDAKAEDQQSVLNAIATRFNGPLAFSSFHTFVKEAGIQHTFFSWA